MRLTQKQELMIARYIHEVTSASEALPERVRERGVRQLEARVMRSLQAHDGAEGVSDTDVMSVLAQLGAPSQQASKIASKPAPQRGLSLCLLPEQAIWLGVCAGVARRFDIAPWVVRFPFFVLGVFTGPLALFGYLFLYAFMHLETPHEKRKPVSFWRLIARPLITFMVAVALHAGTTACLRGVFYLHELVRKQPLPPLGEWGWFLDRGPGLLFWTLAICLPLSVLSALPLANAWDFSIKRLTQALLALYGILLSFGIASVLVGIILHVLHDFVQ